jgi:hypothetical protein
VVLQAVFNNATAAKDAPVTRKFLLFMEVIFLLFGTSVETQQGVRLGKRLSRHHIAGHVQRAPSKQN